MFETANVNSASRHFENGRVTKKIDAMTCSAKGNVARGSPG